MQVRYHITPDGPRICHAHNEDACPYAQQGMPHFDNIDDANVAYESRMAQAFGTVATVKRSAVRTHTYHTTENAVAKMNMVAASPAAQKTVRIMHAVQSSPAKIAARGMLWRETVAARALRLAKTPRRMMSAVAGKIRARAEKRADQRAMIKRLIAYQDAYQAQRYKEQQRLWTQQWLDQQSAQQRAQYERQQQWQNWQQQQTRHNVGPERQRPLVVPPIVATSVMTRISSRPVDRLHIGQRLSDGSTVMSVAYGSGGNVAVHTRHSDGHIHVHNAQIGTRIRTSTPWADVRQRVSRSPFAARVREAGHAQKQVWRILSGAAHEQRFEPADVETTSSSIYEQMMAQMSAAQQHPQKKNAQGRTKPVEFTTV